MEYLIDSFTDPRDNANLYDFFLLQETKVDILKNVRIVNYDRILFLCCLLLKNISYDFRNHNNNTLFQL